MFAFWVGLVLFSSRFLWDSFYHVYLVSLTLSQLLLAHVSPTKDFSGCQEDKSVWGLRKNFNDSNIHYSIHPQDCLVGGWTNPFEKYACQIGSFPQGKDEKLKKMKPPRSCNMEKFSRFQPSNAALDIETMTVFSPRRLKFRGSAE